MVFPQASTDCSEHVTRCHCLRGTGELTEVGLESWGVDAHVGCDPLRFFLALHPIHWRNFYLVSLSSRTNTRSSYTTFPCIFGVSCVLPSFDRQAIIAPIAPLRLPSRHITLLCLLQDYSPPLLEPWLSIQGQTPASLK